MLTRQAIDEIKKGSLGVLVDSGTTRDNVSRLANKYGWSVDIEEKAEGSYRMVLRK